MIVADNYRVLEEKQRSGAPSTPGTAFIGKRTHQGPFDNYSEVAIGVAGNSGSGGIMIARDESSSAKSLIEKSFEEISK